MSLTWDDFAVFFGAIRLGLRPFAWQRRLLDHLLDQGRWPDQVVAPTGAGKTAVVDVHVFACALTAAAGPRLPRRLALVVGRRFLVDSHDEHAHHVADRLRAAASADGVLWEVTEALRRLRPHAAAEDGPLLTARLRGGAPPLRSWRDEPDACAVLVCTPDIVGQPAAAARLRLGTAGLAPGSRAARLRRRPRGRRGAPVPAVARDRPTGRGAARGRRRAAAGASSASGGDHRHPGRADGLRRRCGRGGPGRGRGARRPAAPTQAATTASAPRLADLLRRDAPRQAVATLSDEVERLRAEFGPTVGCVVNRVDLAVDIAAELRRRSRTVELLCGRLRPADLTRLRRRRPGLLTVVGDPDIDVMVATQTLEVGIDIDLSALLTELAPGTALAQRAGRVNRLGRRAGTQVVVAVPDARLDQRAHVAPYRHGELEEARQWLVTQAYDADGLAPWALRRARPPSEEPNRPLFQRVELADSWQWARTGDELFARPDLDLWLADDLAGDRDVGVVVRYRLPEDPSEAAALIRLLPPRPHEVFPARIADVRMLLTRVLSEPDARTFEEPLPVLRVRGDDVEALAVPPEDLRPGDVLVLDDRVELLRGGVVHAEGRERADDVLELGPTALDGSRGAAQVRKLVAGRARGRVLLRLDASSLLDPADAGTEAERVTDLLAWVAAAEEGEVTLPRRQELAVRLDKLADALTADERRLSVLATAQLLQGRAKDAGIHIHYDRSDIIKGKADWVVRRAAADEDLRQTWTPAVDPVPLARHWEAVGARAADLARRLGMGDVLTETLFMAGLHHDDGKADPRFQELLGGVPPDAVLAKSGRRSLREDRAARQSYSLPPGWRHEQLSALLAWRALANRAAPQRALAVRLAATSHGYGRAGFPHTGAELLGDGADPDARTLFDEGEWEALVEATDRRHGVWGVAYLEALLRAADGAVSREGS